jgi:PilZ domain
MSYRISTMAEHHERRTSPRIRLDVQAQIRLTTGSRPAQLVDLSQSGARLDLANPPAQGSIVLLAWHGQEHFCKVMWTAEGACGVQFERLLPLPIVLATTGQDLGVAPAPAPSVANHANIPLGRKRARIGSAD